MHVQIKTVKLVLKMLIHLINMLMFVPNAIHHIFLALIINVFIVFNHLEHIQKLPFNVMELLFLLN